LNFFCCLSAKISWIFYYFLHHIPARGHRESASAVRFLTPPPAFNGKNREFFFLARDLQHLLVA
jgi:hypothetical protein